MALEASCCFQVISTITSSSAAAAPATRNCIRRTLQPLNRDHKQLNNPPAGAPRFAIDGRRGRVICRANNTVDEVVVVVVEKNRENLVMGSEKPVLVEFWGPWCGPCRMIAPVIKDLAKDYAGKIVCCSVNTDDCPGIASRLGIRSIPTVLVFKKGEKKESVIGAVPKNTLVGVVDKYLEL